MGRVSDAKKRLIESAQILIWERSYRAVGVNEICKQAGVKPGSFYYFFPSKSDLAITTLEEGWQKLQNDVFEPAFAMHVAPLDRFTKFYQLIFEDHSFRQQQNSQELGCLFGSFVGELGEQDETIRKKIEQIFSAIRKYFEGALEDAIALGQLNMDFENVANRAEALLAYYEGILILARLENNTGLIRELAPHALNLLNEY